MRAHQLHELAAIMLSIAAQAVVAETVTRHEDLFRVPIPEVLPPHPRVFCTQEDLARIKANAAKGDPYTSACISFLRRRAEACLAKPVEFDVAKPSRGLFGEAELLAQAFALTGDERYGRQCRKYLLALANACPKLKTTRARGRFSDSTLHEGPLAVRVAMAYDLIAGAAFMAESDRRHIEQDLLRVMAWECGHRCHHLNSSNWRSWALAIVASCGFAIGDRALINEAINGVYDSERKAYLYGIVQQLTHSIFSDGVHWERSMGYTSYTGSALMYVMVAAENSGIDLWHADLPGLRGPFEGCAPHEEFGPAGSRSIKAFLDAPFYYAFPNSLLAKYGDSGSSRLSYHGMYELAYREYRDPKYAWLISQRRRGSSNALMGWSLWRPRGETKGEVAAGQAIDGRVAFRMTGGERGRIALVQNVVVPADRRVEVSGKVKALRMAGASAHIRCNFGKTALFTNRVRKPGEWTRTAVDIPPAAGVKSGANRSIRLHVFLEGGAGEVLWDDVRVTIEGRGPNMAVNGSFEADSPDGRRMSFWALVHHAKDIPPGRYDLSEDATIGLAGRHVNGSTLFPIGGFAILRSSPTDEAATAVNFAFGPYGSGHDHPDRLHFDLYGLGQILGPDAGSWGYSNPMHLTWANTTIAHNTVAVDETSQQPQGNSRSIWAGERGSQRVFGVLRLFHSGRHMKAARATCDTAYPGVGLDRTLCLVGGYVLDVFRVSSSEEHTFDWAFHGLGNVSTSAELEPVAKAPLSARGYSHLTQIRRGSPEAGTVRARFATKRGSLQLLHLQPGVGEIILAKDPARSPSSATSCFVARRQGRNALFVSVLEPFPAQPTVRSVAMFDRDETIEVIVLREDGEDRFMLPDAVDGTVTVTWDGAFAERAAAEAVPPRGGD